MAIAMAQEDCWGIEDDGSIMGEFLSTPKVLQLDTVLGNCVLENPASPDPMHLDGYPLRIVRPAVIHFLGHHVSGSLYKSEVVRVRLAYDLRLPPFLASMIGSCYRGPFIIVGTLRKFFRPAYRLFFGLRRVRESPR